MRPVPIPHTSPTAPAVAVEPPRRPTSRHPGDVVRVVLGGAAFAASAAVANTDRVSTFERDVFRLLNHLPSQLDGPIQVVMQAGNLLAVPVAAAAALATRRPRLARDLAIAGSAAWVLAKLAKHLVTRPRPGVLLTDVIVRHANQGGLGFPSGHVTVAAALATAAGPFLPRWARRMTWLVVALVGVARVYVGVHFPADVVGGAALGWVIGATLHLVVGAPVRVIGVGTVTAGLEAARFAPVAIRPAAVDARGSTPFVAQLADGRRMFVKAVDREHRNADLLFKLWRYTIFRHVEDEMPFLSAKQQVEHEAFALVVAERGGVRVPRFEGTVQSGSSPALLVMEAVDGRSLGECDEAVLTAEVLREIWEELARLHSIRVAHRDLRLANVLLDDDGHPWIIDFGFAELSASDHRMTQDVAELLASTSLVVGPERAVESAVAVLGPSAVAGAIPLLQPLALSAATRRALRERDSALDDLRAVAADRTGTESPEVERLVRVHPLTIVWLVFGLLAVHLLLPQVGELHKTVAALRNASVGWLIVMLLASAASYVASAVAQLGSVVPNLALGRTVVVELASSFANRVMPANIGRAGISLRYFERSGMPRADAVGAIAAGGLAGLIVHTVLLVGFGAAVGRGQVASVHLPDRWIVLVVVVVVFAIAGFGLATRYGRRHLIEPAGRSVRALARILRHPRRAAELFGGSVAVTLLYIACLYAALHAFGGGLEWSKVALAYLGASIVAAPAPTPGGLGAVEAALVAGLTALGAATPPSVAGVLAFRLATFWLPIPPGWVAFRVLHKRGVI